MPDPYATYKAYDPDHGTETVEELEERMRRCMWLRDRHIDADSPYLAAQMDRSIQHYQAKLYRIMTYGRKNPTVEENYVIRPWIS